MSSRSQRDFIDYIDDHSLHEDETPFIPVRPDGPPDSWSAFFGGTIIGISGGALVPFAPWLAGALVAIGYGMTAYTLGGSRNRFVRALRFGFAIPALIGAATVVGEALSPSTTWSIVKFLGDRHLIFCGLAAMPWVLTLLKYTYGFFR
jgi:hypothetical protein